MQGCVQRVFFGDVNAATVRVLAPRAGRSTRRAGRAAADRCRCTPAVEDEAIALAKETIAAYEDFDAVAVNVAGCGSGMKDYAHLLADDPEWAERAAAFSARVRDVCELLAEHEPRAGGTRWRCASPTTTPATSRTPRACATQPRELLRGIPGARAARARRLGDLLRLGRDLQPRPARGGGRARAGARRPTSLATGAEAVAAGNPGCALQIAAHLNGSELPIHHPMTLLDHSIRGTRPH